MRTAELKVFGGPCSEFKKPCACSYKLARRHRNFQCLRTCLEPAKRRSSRSQAKCLATHEQSRCQESWRHKLACLVAASSIALCCPQTSIAAVQTVAPQEATSFARSLPQQPVNKGKVWLVFLAGATGLFGAAVAIEKNSSLFPAIAKANQAMAATKAAQKKKQEEDQSAEDVKATEARTEDAVLQGFQDARNRVGEPSRSESEPQAQLQSGGSQDDDSSPKAGQQNGTHAISNQQREGESHRDTVDSHSGGA